MLTLVGCALKPTPRTFEMRISKSLRRDNMDTIITAIGFMASIATIATAYITYKMWRRDARR